MTDQGYTPMPEEGRPSPSPHPAYQRPAPRRAQPNPWRNPGVLQRPARQSGPSAHPPLPPRKRGPNISRRLALFVLVLAAAAGLALGGTALVRSMRYKKVEAEMAPYLGVYGPNVSINDVSISGKTPQQAIESIKAAMQARLNTWQMQITYNGFTYVTLSYPVLGMRFNESDAYPQLNEAWALTNMGDAYRRQAGLETLLKTPYKGYTSQGEISDDRIAAYVREIGKSIRRDPVDAALLGFNPQNKTPFAVQHAVDGRVLDEAAAADEIKRRALSGEAGALDLSPYVRAIAPAVATADVERRIQLRATAETAISQSSDENRNNNIRRAAALISGTILKPGQTFSFNKIVGPRTHKNGFFDAIEYVSGNEITGVGGGVCQVSTTLYQAALLSNLSIVRRGIHSIPVRYTEKGQDATVYLSNGHEIDFRFKNTTEGNLYIIVEVVKGTSSRRLAVRVKMYGVSLGEGVSMKLKSQVVEELLPPPPVYKPDKKGQYVLYVDQTYQVSKERKGYVVTTTLKRFQNGVLVGENFISTDRYEPKAAEFYQGVQER